MAQQSSPATRLQRPMVAVGLTALLWSGTAMASDGWQALKWGPAENQAKALFGDRVTPAEAPHVHHSTMATKTFELFVDLGYTTFFYFRTALWSRFPGYDEI